MTPVNSPAALPLCVAACHWLVLLAGGGVWAEQTPQGDITAEQTNEQLRGRLQQV